LWKVYEGGQLIATYIYNAQGQRTRKITDTETIVYHYDLSGNLISEITDTGDAIRDYVYLNSVPVAQIATDGSTDTISYLHTDHLGTPRRSTNAQGAVTWTWDSDAFGTTAANDDPDNDGTATIINLRFAGQYYDAETGLHYNYFRYYDPGTGRYVTSDPIGLEGGINTYLYVGGNPVNLVDILGNMGSRPKEPWEFPKDHWELPSKCETEKECWDKAQKKILECRTNRACQLYWRYCQTHCPGLTPAPSCDKDACFGNDRQSYG
jgi:RHS repeat-associated protein